MLAANACISCGITRKQLINMQGFPQKCDLRITPVGSRIVNHCWFFMGFVCLFVFPTLIMFLNFKGLDSFLSADTYAIFWKYHASK